MAEGAALKLERASEHIAAVDGVVREWLDSEAFVIEERTDADAGERTEARVRLRGQPPDRLALIIGDAVHCLRTALDHGVFDAAYRAARGALRSRAEQRLMFPVVSRRGEFDNREQRWLDDVPSAVRDVVEQAQPFHWNERDHSNDSDRFHPLWQVNELDRIDKHRRLAVTAAAVKNPAVGVPEGVDSQVKFLHAEGPVRDEQVLATYRGADMGVYFYFEHGVAVMDGDPCAGEALVVEKLDTLLRHVAGVTERIRRAASSV